MNTEEIFAIFSKIGEGIGIGMRLNAKGRQIMRTIQDNNRLCRKLEELAAIFDVFAKGASSPKHGCGRIESAVTKGIIAAEREMMAICRELTRQLTLEDRDSVAGYVSALSESRRRFAEMDLLFTERRFCASAAIK